MKTRTLLMLAVSGCLGVALRPAFAADKPADAPATALEIKDLKTAAEADKLKSLDSLADLGPKAAGEAKYIESLLKDSSSKVRAHAALALGAIGPAAKDSVPALAELLKDPDGPVRRMALHALKEIHPGPKVMVPLCTKMLEESNPMIGGRVLNAIADAGPDAVPGLKIALKDEKAAYWALVALREIGPPAKDAVPEIVEALKDKRPRIRREAVLALGAMGDAAAPAAPEIAKLLTDENAACAATFVLGELKQIPKEAEATIRNNTKSDKGLLSCTSSWALAMAHPEDKELRRETTEKLVERLKDKDGFVRAGAARALAALPPATEIVAPIFEKSLQNADERTVRMAMESIAELGPQAVPRLIDALKYEKLRPEIIFALGRIGPPAAKATEELAKFVDDKDSRVASEAIIALGNIGPGAKAAVPTLTAALDKGNEMDRNLTAIEFALGKIGPDAAPAEASLEKRLTSKTDIVRLMGAWALSHIADTSADAAAKAVPVLTAALTSGDAEEKRLAAGGLGSFGPRAKGAADALKKASGDSDKGVAEAADAALKAVESSEPTSPTPPAAAHVAAADYHPGDQAVTVQDNLEIGVAGKQGKIVPKLTKVKILEIRGGWIGVQAEIDGKPCKGWVLDDQIGRP